MIEQKEACTPLFLFNKCERISWLYRIIWQYSETWYYWNNISKHYILKNQHLRNVWTRVYDQENKQFYSNQPRNSGYPKLYNNSCHFYRTRYHHSKSRRVWSKCFWRRNAAIKPFGNLLKIALENSSAIYYVIFQRKNPPYAFGRLFLFTF